MLIDSLYEQHESDLFRFARSLTRKEKEAEDLVQETFLKALVHLNTLEGLLPPQQRAWLYKVLRNLFYDRTRRNRFEVPMNEEDEPELNPDEYTSIEIQDLLKRLPPQLRKIVYQRYWLGFSSKQIAGPLGVADATIRDRLRTAIRLLKNQLDD